MYLPLTTPFCPDGRLNVRKLEHNVDRYCRTPAAGLTVLGARQGEASLLTEEESREALRAAVGAAANEKVLLAAVSRDSVRATLAMAELAADLRYDALLLRSPSMLTPEDRGELLVYFQIVADRAPLPVVLENAPGARRIPLDATAELARHPNIIGLIDGDDGAGIAETLARTAKVRREVKVTSVFAAVTVRMAAVAAKADSGLVSAAMLTGSAGGAAVAAMPASKSLRTRTKTVGFQVLAGETATMLSGLRAGASGIAARFAACAPQACHEVYAAWKDGDEGLAEEKQARLLAAARAVEASAGATKLGCDLNGYFGGWPRLPLLPPSGDERAEIERLMQGLRS
jgi:dihydrodipicolinate synthase/N-acetylneuraminate lyase